MPSLVHDGLDRTYLLHAPSNVTERGRMPLFITLHGSGGSGRHMMKLTGFDALADARGFVVCYPDAYQRSWNDGRRLENVPAMAQNIDDVGFVSALIGAIAEQLPIDLSRVYLVGASNGGMMSLYYACRCAARIAAVGAVMATVADLWGRSLRPALPVPAVLIHGTHDPILPYDGGFVTFQGETFGRAVSVQETARLWASHNDCDPIPAVADLTKPDADMRVYSETYGNRCNGSEVIAVTVEGGGHTWPGGPQYLAEWIIGNTCRSFDASRYIVDFLLRHRRSEDSVPGLS